MGKVNIWDKNSWKYFTNVLNLQKSVPFLRDQKNLHFFYRNCKNTTSHSRTVIDKIILVACGKID